MTLPGFPEAAPLAGLAAGVLIGLAAALMLLALGRIPGVSGLAAKAVGLSGSGLDRSGTRMFVIGLPRRAPVVLVVPGRIDSSLPSPATLVVTGLALVVEPRLRRGYTTGRGVGDLS